LARQTIHLRDLAGPSGQKGFQQPRNCYHSILVAPLMHDGAAIGTISLGRKHIRPFSDEQLELLGTFANAAAINIGYARLFNELEERAEEQTATTEILRVISQSQSDVQPVFEAIAANAGQLCQASIVGLWTYDGQLLHVAALEGFPPDAR